MSENDTICAIATPPGTGGVGIVRLSGPDVPDMAHGLLGSLPDPRVAKYANFRNGGGKSLDSGIAIYFPQPRSFTGEHVLELQGHGGPVVLQLLVQRAMELGARMARPGEFSERAFLNGRIDLIQAEAIADLIESGTEAAARAAQRSLEGRFSEEIQGFQKAITKLRVFVESAIDFPDEEIDFLTESDVSERLLSVISQLEGLLDRTRQGRLLRDGIVIAITGRPNAGKSSLLNALAESDVAIVTEIPGTTRDILREQIHIDGMPLHVVDTAGIRDTDDPIEIEGIRRARGALASADIVLNVIDSTTDDLPQAVDKHSGIQVLNKVDLLDESQRATLESALEQREISGVPLSARTGEGLDLLKGVILTHMGAASISEGSFSARQRHVDALRRVQDHLREGRLQLVDHQAGELLAEELRLAQKALGEITGEVTPDDLLGEIFASFCIGK